MKKNIVITLVVICLVYLSAYFGYNGFPEFDRTIWYIDFTIYLLQFIGLIIFGLAFIIFLFYILL